jgi:hypothetical protein
MKQSIPASHMPASPTPRRPFLQVLPHTLDRGGHRHGGGADGEGAKSPLPCLWLQYAGIPHPAPAFSPGSPPYAGPWGTSPRGWGRRGGGKKPPPLSLVAICRHLRDLASIWQPCPPCLSALNMPASPTPPGLWPPPPPPGGRGQSWRYPGKAASGAYHQTLDRGRHRHGGRGQSWRYPGKTASGRANPRPAFSPGSPHTLDRGDISTGVGQTGRGQKAPSPVSGCNMPASA